MSTPSDHSSNGVGYPRQSPKVYFDRSYIYSAPGILKIAQALASFLGLVCLYAFTTTYYFPAETYYEFVASTAITLNLILGVLHLFHIPDACCRFLPCLSIEMMYSLVCSLLFCIAGGVAASWASSHTAMGASSFFAFVATLLYGYEAVEKSRRRLREGGRYEHQRPRGGSCATIS